MKRRATWLPAVLGTLVMVWGCEPPPPSAPPRPLPPIARPGPSKTYTETAVIPPGQPYRSFVGFPEQLALRPPPTVPAPPVHTCLAQVTQLAVQDTPTGVVLTFTAMRGQEASVQQQVHWLLVYYSTVRTNVGVPASTRARFDDLRYGARLELYALPGPDLARLRLQVSSLVEEIRSRGQCLQRGVRIARAAPDATLATW